MGSPAADLDAGTHEKPQHQVRITRSFYLGATEVTQRKYRRFVERGRLPGGGRDGWQGRLRLERRNEAIR